MQAVNFLYEVLRPVKQLKVYGTSTGNMISRPLRYSAYETRSLHLQDKYTN
jgi:hypothetical protein